MSMKKYLLHTDGILTNNNKTNEEKNEQFSANIVWTPWDRCYAYLSKQIF